jgi:hypothetical protein
LGVGNIVGAFSVWGRYGGLGGLQLTVQIAAVLLAFALAVVPRRPDLVGLAAACAAVIIATQLALGYWFYFYIPWFFPLAMLALPGALQRSGAPQAAGGIKRLLDRVGLRRRCGELSPGRLPRREVI